MILIVMGDHIEIEGPLKEEGTKIKMEGYWIEEIIKVEDILKEGIQIKVEDPLNDPLYDGGPPDDGGLPDDGGPPDNGRPPGDG